VRAWFNALAAEENAARGRDAIEKLLQREGKTALRHDDLAEAMGFDSAQALFEAVGKEELSLRAIEQHLKPPEALEPPDEVVIKRARSEERQRSRRKGGKGGGAGAGGAGGVLVVGVGSLLTQLARCCKPAPPDDIRGFVTRGKGVSIHRSDCPDYTHLAGRHPDRVIDVQWTGGTGGAGQGGHEPTFYPVDVAVEAADRQGLLRDISDVFAREKINVIGVQTQSVRGVAWMTFTVEVPDAGRVGRVMSAVSDVAGVRQVRRR
jgi:GTP pyrophosphokinase